MSPKTLKTLLDRVDQTEFAHAGPFPIHMNAGAGRAVLIAGANASGKSLVFRLLAQFANDEKIAPITLSIRERSGSGTFEMASFRRSVIYGEEHEQSTGAVSISVIRRGFDNVAKRLENGTRSVLMLDEPEMGLSEGYCRALGKYLAEQVIALPEEAPGIIVVSHSRPLMESLADGLGENPHFIHTGPKPLTLRQWLAAPEERSVEDLMNLEQLGHQGRRAFDEWIKGSKAHKKTKADDKIDESSTEEKSVPSTTGRANRNARPGPGKRA
jgi:hypothetical protein